MNALIVLRPDASTRHGGDVVLARNIAQALAAIGVAAKVEMTADPDARGYDVAHVFGVFEPEVAQRQFAACRQARVPLAVTPIWMDVREIHGLARACERALRGTRRAARARKTLAALRAQPADRHLGRRDERRIEEAERLQAQLLQSADVLVPNGAIEARECSIKLDVHNVPLVIAQIPASRGDYVWSAVRRGVVCVGRVETRKNQALLAFALRDDPIDVSCIGDAYDRLYFDNCKRWAGPRTRFFGLLPDEEVARHLASAAVHAMPSWNETAGVASLDAALAGAQLVVGDRGSEVEYFGDDAEYADPSDPDSIRTAVIRAFRRPPRRRGDSLDVRVRTITWQLAAERTKEAYEIALSRR